MTDTLWVRLEARWTSLCKDLPRGGLNAPATAGQIEAVESLTGIRLPLDLRDAYLEFNGMQRDAFVWNSKIRIPQVILNRFHWLDLESLATRWTQDRCSEAGSDIDPELFGPEEAEGNSARQREFHAGWLPIGYSGTIVSSVVDMAPSRSGRPGQVLSCNPEAGTPRAIAPSFSDCVRAMLDAFDRGAVVWDGWSIVSSIDNTPINSFDDWLNA